MIIETLTWGEVEVKEEQLFHFPKGIPGFDDDTEFALLEMEDNPFWVLQSVNEQGHSFLLGDPFVFYPSYEFELLDEEAEELGIESEVMICCVITLKKQVEESTINLLAPIVMNPVTHRGKQVVLHRAAYHTKHSLMQEQMAIDGKDGG